MATLRLVTARDPKLLLERAADGFLVARPASADNPFPTVPYLLALRQGGLRDDVIELAAARGLPGWFDPPLCIFGELPRWFGVPARQTLGEVERLVVLERVIRSDPHSVFARLDKPSGFVDSVDHLFGELVSERVSADDFRGALTRPDRDAFETERDATLAQTYAGYLDELARLGRADGRDTWSKCADIIAENPSALGSALGGRREIRIFGLQDLRRGWRRLLAALVVSPAIDSVAIYTSAELPLAGFAVEYERLHEPDSAAVRLFTTAPTERRGAATLVAAPDAEREADEVARRVRKLLEAGSPPHRIAVVSRSARPHTDLLVASLRRFGLPASARQRVRLREIPAVRAALTLFTAAAEGWTRHGLVEIADQPYLDCELDPQVIDHGGFGFSVNGLAQWSDQLRALEVRARSREAAPDDSHEEHERRLPAARRVAHARSSFDRFAARAAVLDRLMTLPGWLRWLDTFLADDPWQVRARINDVADGRFDLVRLDIAGWNRMRAIIGEWRKAVGPEAPDEPPIGVTAFAARLTHSLDGDVALWTPVHRGVQVLEALAAAYRSFDHIFIVGMESGSFPSARPSSPVLDDVDRGALVALGIPLDLPEVWDQRERELFRVLVGGAAGSLTVSYARLDANGREVISSAFVEELSDVVELRVSELPSYQVVTDGIALAGSDRALGNASRMARIEREREAGFLTPHNGHITAPDLVAVLEREFGDDRLWSPTQLEDMAKCAWAYMSKRLLRIESLAEPSEDIERTTSGIVLHKTLERFYSAAKQKLGTPVFLLPDDATWAESMLVTALGDALTEVGEVQWLGHPLLREARTAEFRRIAWRFLQWEMELHHDMTDPTTKKRNAPAMVRTAVDVHELKFTDMRYSQDGVTIRYRGSIDRVEVGIDERAPGEDFVAAADYKSSKGSTPGGGAAAAWADGVVLQIPLYAHALAKLRLGSKVARIAYLALRKPEAVHSLELYTFRKRETLQLDLEARAKWDSALTAAIDAVRRARRGEFPAQPKPSCNCPPWCHGWDICRVKGGPT